MNICQSMRKLTHVMTTHLRRSVVVKSSSVALFVPLTFIQIVSPSCALFFWSDAPTTLGEQPISWNAISASSEAKPQVTLLIDPSKIPPDANKAQLDERQSIGIGDETLRLVSAPKAAGRAEYIELVRSQAEQNGLPADIADAVVYIESSYHLKRLEALVKSA
jgi:hypothetical protein